MDQAQLANVLQQLAQAIIGAQAQAQAQAQQQQQQQQQPAAVPANDNVSPYQGGALDLTTKTGQSLFFEGSKPLLTKYSGKAEQAFLFLGDLKERARACYWDRPTAEHGILEVTQDGEVLNLLEHYGQITSESMQAAVDARNNGNDVRARQNAQMMHACVYNSITDDAKSAIVSGGVPDDGPLLFYKIMLSSFTATFSYAQATRIQLINLQPKKFAYDVLKINDQVRISLDAIKVATVAGQSVSNQEALFYLFEIYKRIKVPRSWVSHISYLESKAGMETNYQYTSLMNEAGRKYQELRDKGEWKASDTAPEEQIIALMANFKSAVSKDKEKDKRKGKSNDNNQPPFLFEETGQVGDEKEWEGKTFYRCDGPHRSKWVRHKPGECNKKKGGAAKSKNDNKKREDKKGKGKLIVDRDKLKKMMVAMAESGAADPEQQAMLVMSAFDNNQNDESSEGGDDSSSQE